VYRPSPAQSRFHLKKKDKERQRQGYNKKETLASAVSLAGETGRDGEGKEKMQVERQSLCSKETMRV
jgi:hypothetical protein